MPGSQGFLSRLRAHLAGRALDETALDEIETRLLMADCGIEATARVIDSLRDRAGEADDGDPMPLLADVLSGVLDPVAVPLRTDTGGTPFTILVVGVNGAGKTTTIGKLAARFKDEGLSVMLAAGDTFRAAAVEQLQAWGARNDVPVVAQAHGADPAAVAFDALESATARGLDVLIVDTAGRLHNKGNLMDELRKVHRVLGKPGTGAPHEVLLVLDATTGQNALVQALQFRDAVPVSGIVLTKLDGTAKGGIVFALAERTGIPIRYLGTGEKAADLEPFVARGFVDRMLGADA